MTGLTGNDKEELYRRLAQLRRMIVQPLDELTKKRLKALAAELESKLAEIEAGDTDSAPE